MPDALERRRQLASARAELLERPDVALPGIPGHVVASWRRSVARGVDPDRVVNNRFHPDLPVDSRLVRCARPVLEQLAEQLADVPVCLVLTDDRARLLVRLDTTPGIGRAADGNRFAEGFGFEEGEAGTNGVGTVLEFGASVHIVGAEHFVERLHPYACAGAPVHDPFTGRVAGVVDVSCHAEHSSPMLHSLVRSAAARIQDALLRDRDAAQQALFDVYSRLDARTRHAVLAVGKRTVMANRAMQTMLVPGDLAALQDHARFVTRRRTSVDEQLDLPSGARIRLRGTTVELGGDVAGLVGVAELRREAERARLAHPPRPALPPTTSTCPAHREAWSRAASAIRDATPLLVLGEAGTGRRRMVVDLDAALHGPGCVIVVEAGDPVPEPGRDHPLVLLTDVDRLDEAAATRLLTALDRHGARIAATADSARRDRVPAALLRRLRQSVTVPPLRHRGADLPVLAHSLLTELAPGREVPLSAPAVRTLTRYAWPGNVPELRAALEAALAHRPVGELQAEDLPAFCQSAPRGELRAVEMAERDAIVAALRDTGGNRRAAAAALGLARSTLYRKIAQYRISG